ncbi:hypothetical protein Trydic_g11145 [Trypoxylus dichotomus]
MRYIDSLVRRCYKAYTSDRSEKPEHSSPTMNQQRNAVFLCARCATAAESSSSHLSTESEARKTDKREDEDRNSPLKRDRLGRRTSNTPWEDGSRPCLTREPKQARGSHPHRSENLYTHITRKVTTLRRMPLHCSATASDRTQDVRLVGAASWRARQSLIIYETIRLVPTSIAYGV